MAFLFSLPIFRVFYRLRVARREVIRAVEGGLPQVSEKDLLDRLNPSDIPSSGCRGLEDRVLAEIDQDEFLFARDEADVPYFNQRETRLPKNRYRLEVVLVGGDVCVRKEFKAEPLRKGLRDWFWSRMGIGFYTEAAALLRLRGLSCVPSIRSIDLPTKSITMDYIHGASLRHRLARLDDTIYDLDFIKAKAAFTDDEREGHEIALYRKVNGFGRREEIRAIIGEINRCGVLLLDVKFGNLLIGGESGQLYWIDFERARLSSFDRWKEHLSEQNEMVEHWFGLKPEGSLEAPLPLPGITGIDR